MDVAIQECNSELQSLECELSQVGEIMQTLSAMVQEQGEQLAKATTHLDETEIYINEGIQSLAYAKEVTSELRGKLVDGITLGLTTLGGATGFLAGPLVGGLTLVSGITLGVSIIAARRKLT